MLLQCIAVFQTFLLLCLGRGFWDWAFILAGTVEENPCHNALSFSGCIANAPYKTHQKHMTHAPVPTHVNKYMMVP